jgi:hypothetical protein
MFLKVYNKFQSAPHLPQELKTRVYVNLARMKVSRRTYVAVLLLSGSVAFLTTKIFKKDNMYLSNCQV